jgi:hypothetical protein
MTTKKLGFENNLFNSLLKGGLATILLTLFFLFYTTGNCATSDLLIALPFFLLFYFALFTMGREAVIQSFQEWIKKNRWNVLAFPVSMFVIYIIYLLINGQALLDGNPWLLFYLTSFPVVVYALRNQPERKIGWLDFTVFLLVLLPGSLFSIKQNSEMPIHGSGFDSISHVMIMLSGVYAYAVVRNVREVGFVAEINWKSLFTALWVWAAFYLVVFFFGRSVNFIAIIGYSEPLEVLAKTILFTLIGTFLHTALFEELFFRGILQNMLAKRIGQGKSWLIFWVVALVILFPAALLVGYTLEGQMKWFPALITLVMFGAAYLIEKSGKYGMGVYTSLAITGVCFGLVHYHAKSIIYIGLACVAGWAYGYTYIKTKNVFYSAVVHALVGTGAMIFGLKLIL